jgi:hypothetical protein
MTDPRLVGAITLPDGSHVRGRALRRPVPAGPLPDFGLYLGSARHPDGPDWPHAWIDWPDFRLPRDPQEAVRRIRRLHERARDGFAVEVACGGGIGRTGTVIAALAICAGLPPAEAVPWTRTHYHRRAVETPWQRRWVTRFPSD